MTLPVYDEPVFEVEAGQVRRRGPRSARLLLPPCRGAWLASAASGGPGPGARYAYPLRFPFASKPEVIGPVLGIVQRLIAGWLADQAGINRAHAHCDTVTRIQRCGSALDLNVHLHMLWLDGVYEDSTERPQCKPRLRRAPTTAQFTHLAGKIAHRVCQHLARKGWLEGEKDSVDLTDSATSPIARVATTAWTRNGRHRGAANGLPPTRTRPTRTPTAAPPTESAAQ